MRPGVLGMSFDQLASLIGGLGVLAWLVEMVERHPDLAALGLVRLLPGVPPNATIVVPGSSANAVRLMAGRTKTVYHGVVQPLAVEFERRAPSLDKVQLLLRVVC